MKKVLSLFVLSFVLIAGLFAEETSVKNLYQYKLKNGLCLYVAENHNAPLAYIEIAVKAGAVAQTPENAGLFHLYEHIMFKGNEKFPNAESMQTAIKELGCTSWNGTTGAECVNYFFTIPSDRLEEGLDFWNQAIRNPLMDKREFEAEKKVVLAEISTTFNDVDTYSSLDRFQCLFPETPWRTDAGGDPAVIEKATISQLKKIQKAYYVPNNAALFVGGDVDPDEVYQLVEKIFGSWKKGKDPWKGKQVQMKMELPEPVYRVIPYQALADQLCQVVIEWRGPDAEFDVEDTYAADLFTFLAEEPYGLMKTTLVQNPMLGIPDPQYVGSMYVTQRFLGDFVFQAVMVSPEQNLVERVDHLVQTLPELLRNTAGSFTEDNIAIGKEVSENLRILSAETATSLLTELRTYFCVAGENYYFDYLEKLSSVTRDDMVAFIDKYITGKNPVVSVYVNPAVYELLADSFSAAGYKTVLREGSIWHENKGKKK